MRRQRLVLAVSALALVALTVFGIQLATAQSSIQHGIGFTKGCVSPTKIGDPYQCSYGIRNVLDEAQDTLTISGLVDVVHSSAGDVSSGNMFSSLRLTVSGGATCT